jgi:hypothetical protein
MPGRERAAVPREKRERTGILDELVRLSVE